MLGIIITVCQFLLSPLSLLRRTTRRDNARQARRAILPEDIGYTKTGYPMGIENANPDHLELDARISACRPRLFDPQEDWDEWCSYLDGTLEQKEAALRILGSGQQTPKWPTQKTIIDSPSFRRVPIQGIPGGSLILPD